ncbi:MAG: hypothetical protein RSD93_06135, partial [Gordonibacter sp.]
TILYNDLFVRFIDRKPHRTNQMGVTRICALLIGVVVMVCALWINDVLVGIDISYGYLSGCVFVPLVASFVLKRFSPKAGLYALAVSAVVVTGCFLTVGTASSIPIVAGMTSGLVAYLIVNLLSKQKVTSPFIDDAAGALETQEQTVAQGTKREDPASPQAAGEGSENPTLSPNGSTSDERP